jgi:hypothetical protein
LAAGDSRDEDGHATEGEGEGDEETQPAETVDQAVSPAAIGFSRPDLHHPPSERNGNGGSRKDAKHNNDLFSFNKHISFASFLCGFA